MKNLGYSVQQRHLIDDDSKVGEARRAAQLLADFDFDAENAGKVAIATTELANNLMRHAGGGEILMQWLGSEDAPTFELLAIDRGPGMSNVERCMADGYSTGGTSGTGLGAVRRLATEFDILSVPGEGTIVMARFGKPLALKFGAVSVALAGEFECGDSWKVFDGPDATSVIVLDGLGHGSFAAEASLAGIGAFNVDPLAQPQEILLRATAAMSKTRGGAGACARISRTGEMTYAGIGNIAGCLVSYDKSQGLASHNGTLGMPLRRIQQHEYNRTAGSLVVMHSDGLSTRWSLKDRPELFTHHPALIAALLYRDHGRERDDATVVVVA